MSELITCALAKKILAAQRFDWGVEEIPLEEARGRILAEDLTADRDQPPFDRVAMDGITIDHSAYAAGRRYFARAHVQAAGEAPTPLPDATNCVEIMTGAALPDGCTTVIRYEDLREDAGGYHLPDELPDGNHIHARGKDTQAGSILAKRGDRIGTAHVGMLATCGYATVRVTRRPRIAIVATGDELVPVAEQPAPHQIRLSNVYQLSALLASRGYTASTHHVTDDEALLRERLTTLLDGHELLILSGGVSKGKFDFVPGILQEVGVDKLFHRVAQRPGKPLWVGRNARAMVFGLPGNPQSSLSCCLAYVLPWLADQAGTEPRSVFAELTEAITFTPQLTLFAYVEVWSDAASGRLLARSVRHAGSGDAAALLRGKGFMELPPEADNHPAGGVYEVRLLNPL